MKTWRLLHAFFVVCIYQWFFQVVGVGLDCALDNCGFVHFIVHNLYHTGAFVLSVLSLVLFVKGLFLMQSYGDTYNYDSVHKCEDLHNTAWWVFGGLMLVTLPIVCMSACCLACTFASCLGLRAP